MTEPDPPPPSDDASDRALDDRVRAAAAALLALAPQTRLDGLAARVENELAEPRTERRMMSDSEKSSGRDSLIPAVPKQPRNEDSGLHDIKALAQDTRKRISRRITSQHDIEPQLLSASQSLRTVALPEPALVVSLPEVPSTMQELRAAPAGDAAAATATASEGASITPIKKKRTGLFLGLGAAGLAAAAAIVIVASGGSKGEKSSAAPALAANEEKAAAGPTAAQAMRAAAPAAGSGLAEPAADSVGGAGSAAPAAPPPSTVVAAAPENEADRAETAAKLQREEGKRAAGGSGSGSAVHVDKGDGGKPGGGAATGGKTEGAGSGSAKPAGGKGDPKAAKPGDNTKPGEKSIEDLLNDASGGPTKPKDTGGGGAVVDSAPKAPDKTGLDSSDIKKGMGGVAGKAQGCFDQHGVAGHVKIRATVAPSGDVTKVEATGEFAGTPTGACVAGVVKGASFPAWSGAPMTINYAFTLQE